MAAADHDDVEILGVTHGMDRENRKAAILARRHRADCARAGGLRIPGMGNRGQTGKVGRSDVAYWHDSCFTFRALPSGRSSAWKKARGDWAQGPVACRRKEAPAVE
jgi:hypothetical protein